MDIQKLIKKAKKEDGDKYDKYKSKSEAFKQALKDKGEGEVFIYKDAPILLKTAKGKKETKAKKKKTERNPDFIKARKGRDIREILSDFSKESGYDVEGTGFDRTPEVNDRVGGSDNSYHKLEGMAGDFKLTKNGEPLSPEDLKRAKRLLRREGASLLDETDYTRGTNPHLHADLRHSKDGNKNQDPFIARLSPGFTISEEDKKIMSDADKELGAMQWREEQDFPSKDYEEQFGPSLEEIKGDLVTRLEKEDNPILSMVEDANIEEPKEKEYGGSLPKAFEKAMLDKGEGEIFNYRDPKNGKLRKILLKRAEPKVEEVEPESTKFEDMIKPYSDKMENIVEEETASMEDFDPREMQLQRLVEKGEQLFNKQDKYKDGGISNMENKITPLEKMLEDLRLAKGEDVDRDTPFLDTTNQPPTTERPETKLDDSVEQNSPTEVEPMEKQEFVASPMDKSAEYEESIKPEFKPSPMDKSAEYEASKEEPGFFDRVKNFFSSNDEQAIKQAVARPETGNPQLDALLKEYDKSMEQYKEELDSAKTKDMWMTLAQGLMDYSSYQNAAVGARAGMGIKPMKVDLGANYADQVRKQRPDIKDTINEAGLYGIGKKKTLSSDPNSEASKTARIKAKQMGIEVPENFTEADYDKSVNALIRSKDNKLRQEKTGERAKDRLSLSREKFGFQKDEKNELSDAQTKELVNYNQALNDFDIIDDLKVNTDTGFMTNLGSTVSGYFGVESSDTAELKMVLLDSLAKKLNALSGTAAAEAEVARIKQTLPNLNDDDALFIDKLKRAKKSLENNRKIFIQTIGDAQGKDISKVKERPAVRQKENSTDQFPMKLRKDGKLVTVENEKEAEEARKEGWK